jgi:predicted RNA-binding Zn-ribbon protein involved in translation (DUF1610 family)
MTAPSFWKRVSCPRCAAASLCDLPQMLARLRDLGMLRRETEPSRELVAELFTSAAGRMICPSCNHRGLSVAEADDEWDDSTWTTGRPCADCGQLIAAERLAAFPDAQRCVSCQQAADRGADSSPVEYCPRCGTPMALRPRRGRALAGYEMFCPQCRR